MMNQQQILASYGSAAAVVTPGSSTFSTSGNFTVPAYNTLVIELWGAGSPGGGRTSAAIIAGGAGNASSLSALSLTANGGGTTGTTTTTPGAGGTASGGDTNTTGTAGSNGAAVNTTAGAGGAGANGGAGGAGNSGNAAGHAGTAPGGGGGGAASNATGGEIIAPGGGGGAYCKKTYTLGVGSAPSVGAVLAFVVGASKAGSGTTDAGGTGAAGQAKFTWS